MMVSISISTFILILFITAFLGGGVAWWVNSKINKYLNHDLRYMLEFLKGETRELQEDFRTLKRDFKEQGKMASCTENQLTTNRVEKPILIDRITNVDSEKVISERQNRLDYADKVDDLDIPAFLRRRKDDNDVKNSQILARFSDDANIHTQTPDKKRKPKGN